MSINSGVLVNFWQVSVTFIASMLIWVMLGGAYLYLYLNKARRFDYLLLSISALFTLVLADIVKKIIPVARPYLLEGEKLLTTTYHLDSSYPSTHSAVAFAIAMAIGLVNSKAGFMFFMLSFLVGLGRILSNAHFAVDVTAGAALGVFVALFVEKLLRKMYTKTKS